MKKFTALLISITILLVVWACTDLDHSNPFDPEYWKSENVKPSNLYVEQISITQSKISWTDNSSEDNFMIEKTIDGYTNWEIIGNVPGDINELCTKFFIDSCNSPGFSYRYRIQAQFDDFASEKSEQIVYISDFNAPTKLSSSNLMNSYILLNWADNSKGEQGFVIDRKMSTSGILEFEYAVIDRWLDDGSDVCNGFQFFVNSDFHCCFSFFRPHIGWFL